MSKANDVQVGGDHYKKRAEGGFQHWDWIVREYGAGYLIGCATKYITRHRDKNGAQDLQKARHYVLKLGEAIADNLWTPPPPAQVEVGDFNSTNDIGLWEARVISRIVDAQTQDDCEKVASVIEEHVKYHYRD